MNAVLPPTKVHFAQQSLNVSPEKGGLYAGTPGSAAGKSQLWARKPTGEQKPARACSGDSEQGCSKQLIQRYPVQSELLPELQEHLTEGGFQ